MHIYIYIYIHIYTYTHIETSSSASRGSVRPPAGGPTRIGGSQDIPVCTIDDIIPQCTIISYNRVLYDTIL